jgi:hypothetical protein
MTTGRNVAFQDLLIDCVGAAINLRKALREELREIPSTHLILSMLIVDMEIVLDPQMTMYSMHSYKKSGVRLSYAPAEYLTIGMCVNKHHLLFDWGKTMNRCVLPPGGTVDSLPMITCVHLNS